MYLRRHMMNENLSTGSSINVSEDAIAAIAALAATDIEGVASMAGNLTNAIIAKLGVKNLSKGVRISLDGSNVSVYLSLNVDFGANVPEVSAKVRDKVKSQVENMTGLTVTEVDVHIHRVDTSKF
ncbi:MAG: Asp23/Gls24 family envelope stress response protein [Lachnospiraceae bacterium]|nr:Asp23/Gls24 family envelope stress response protein [Candidatus Hippenecus merdae]